MDIAITLPKNLWDKICSGEKQFECRKYIPRNFMRDYDKVWVIIKGTNKVAGFFKIDNFLTCVEVSEVAEKYLDKICIDKSWLEQYTRHEDVLQLWQIGSVLYELAIPQNREEFLDLLRNPQKYAYCRPNIDDQRFFARGRAFKTDAVLPVR